MLARVDLQENREALLARLTAAAYQVALRHGKGCSFADLELGLWRALRSKLLEEPKEVGPNLPTLKS